MDVGNYFGFGIFCESKENRGGMGVGLHGYDGGGDADRVAKRCHPLSAVTLNDAIIAMDCRMRAIVLFRNSDIVAGNRRLHRARASQGAKRCFNNGQHAWPYEGRLYCQGSRRHFGYERPHRLRKAPVHANREIAAIQSSHRLRRDSPD